MFFRLAAFLFLLPLVSGTISGVIPGAAIAYAASAAPTRTTLAASTSTMETGTGATLTATVKTTLGAPVDAGTVDFVLPNAQSLGSAIVAPDGTATLVVAKLPAGVPAITGTNVNGGAQLGLSAVYHGAGGSSAFADSASVITAVAIPAATTQAPDFVVTGNPTTVTTPQGSYASTAITVTSVGGYTGAIQFSCNNLPAQVTCAFNPTQQLLGANGTFVSTLQLQTQSASGTASSAIFVHSDVALALVIPGALVFLGLRGRRRKEFGGAQLLGATLLLAGATLGLGGCSQRYGYLHHPPSIAGGTPTGTFAITVAVDGSQGSSVIEHDVTVSLVVK